MFHLLRARPACVIDQGAALVAMLLLGLGCGEGGRPAQSADPATAADAGATDSLSGACAKAAAGTSCGDGKHCIGGRCQLNLCGDGIAADDEECDDGNQVVGDGCTPSCDARPPSCGDANRDDGEECDDGNWYNEDACSNDCTSNDCGNGRQEAIEECDDGNLVDTDACSLACTENRCRNGRLDPGEECDDGNQIHGDGCSNGCLSIGCGNGKVDDASRGGDEECDDGNRVDDDACANACTSNRCGNARVDPGEVCDGDTATQSCSDDCKQASNNDACKGCRERHCAAYMDALDLVAGCVNQPDQTFRDKCTSVIDCAKSNRCGYAADGPAQCFCGSADVASCQTAGVANGPCQDEWFAAANTTLVGDLFGRFSSLEFPSGWAFYLMECERDLCADECVP